jgi:hypothetical protein
VSRRPPFEERLARRLHPNPDAVDLSLLMKCGGHDPSVVGCLAFPAALALGIGGQLGVMLWFHRRLRLVVIAAGTVTVHARKRWWSTAWTRLVEVPAEEVELIDLQSFMPKMRLRGVDYWIPDDKLLQLRRALAPRG